MKTTTDMTPETVFYEGRKGAPLAVFVHGLGMDHKFWSAPSEASMLDGQYPLLALAPGLDSRAKTSFSDLREMGFGVLTWSQSQPVGPLAGAVVELSALIDKFAAHAKAGVILVGHSRGGLVARLYLESVGSDHVGPSCVKGLLTISAPHHGTSLAGWSSHLSPVASLLGNFMGGGSAHSEFKWMVDFFGSEGHSELAPGSTLFSRLRNIKPAGVRCVSVGATRPDLIHMAGHSPADLHAKWMEMMMPEELRDGMGDGLVSARSAVLPYGDEHRNFSANHLSVVFDPLVRAYAADFSRSFLGRTDG
jgi:pimeloyl-ACP methyl ester carboxylesterase